MIEHSLVTTVVPVEEIPIGTKGTIVFVHEGEKCFEVEFNFDGCSVVKSVSSNQIKLLK